MDAEIGFVNYLANEDICVAEPVASLKGSCVMNMESSAGLLHTSVFIALPGKRNRHSWREHMNLIETYLPSKEYAAWRQLEQVKRNLDSLPTDDNCFGLIHYDFELDNIVWDGEIAGIIDFDDCAQYWYVADICFALRDLFEDRADCVDFDSESFRLFIQGYKTARDISPGDLRLIPVFMRMHNLTVFARLLRTLENTGNSVEPEWMDGLRTKLLNKLDSYREAFIVYPDVE